MMICNLEEGGQVSSSVVIYTTKKCFFFKTVLERSTQIFYCTFQKIVQSQKECIDFCFISPILVSE